jgi:hypothetical protein
VSIPYWNGRNLLVDGMTIATLIPANLAGLPDRWSVKWRDAQSTPCTWQAARELAEGIARAGIARPTKTAGQA